MWACDEHAAGDPLRTVEYPAAVKAQIAHEEDQRERMRKRYTLDVHPEKSESVKFLASTGHGDPLGFNRAVSFRWGENPGDVSEGFTPRELPARTKLVIRLKARERSAA